MDFDGTAELAAGAEKNIVIKKNPEGFEFGLSVAKENAGQNQTEYLATMFDAQEVAKGKLIKVWRESGEDKASIVLTDGTEQPLINTRTIRYREQDRINSLIQGNVASSYLSLHRETGEDYDPYTVSNFHLTPEGLSGDDEVTLGEEEGESGGTPTTGEEDQQEQDFEELSFTGKESKIYFNGALKISSTTFESQFDFRGRIARAADFEAVTSYLRSEENMASIVHKIRWPFSLLLWQDHRLH